MLWAENSLDALAALLVILRTALFVYLAYTVVSNL
jgi:hypothetical protein